MTTWQPDPRDVDADDLPGGGVDRRTFLRRLVELGAGSALAGILGSSRAGAAPIATSFPDGVMSGDPSPGRGTLRTRVEPPPDGRPLPVIWLVATDPGLRQVVRGGLVWATAAHGHSVHAFPDKLGYDRWLHYGFFAPGARSQVGRMRIAPRPGSSPDVLKYAFCSCQQRGPYYVAHKSMVEEGINFFRTSATTST